MRAHKGFRGSRGFVVLLIVATAVAAGIAATGPAAPHPSPAPRGGAVASSAPAATEAGLLILREGGNAADAAVAVALALAVVHPQAGNLGGGGFAVARFGDEVAALDFRETAPAAATAGMFLGPDGSPVAERSLVGPLAAGVPGSPAGLFELHHRFGRLPWIQVVAPAARLARGGFPVTERLSRAIAEDRALLARFPETAAVWLPGGQPPAAGTTVRLPRLAKVLDAYGRLGPKALTRGRAAEAIEAASRKHGGILTAADLAAYAPVWRAPVRLRAFGWEIASMPLPSSGGIILGETFGMLERLGFAALPKDGADRAHLSVEAWRRAFADRFLLGDPMSTGADATQLLDPSWLDRRAREIDRARATPSASVKNWPGGAAEPTQTTHLSVVDARGDAVAMTVTLNDTFGCRLLVPELEILLNNEMDDFAAAPGKANLYGLVQGPANAVGPGKRMLSSMSPTLAWKGSEILAIGSPGGSHIPTAVGQTLLRILVDGESLLDAVTHPRIHHQWMPDEVAVEAGALSGEVRGELARRGHVLKEVKALGEVDAARRRADGRLEAAADPRGPGAASVEEPRK
ncbi:MAG: gamma-glutamyltransferase [Acidobacteriia bacterium]|nr:gamma-glutamyltransferase [Terriglobia bacterium]